MKNLFGIVVEKNRNEIYEGECFITKRIDDDLRKRIVLEKEEMDNKIEALTPIYVILPFYLAFLVGIILTCVFFIYGVREGFDLIWSSNKKLFLFIGLGLIGLYFFSYLFFKIRQRLFIKSKFYLQKKKNLNELSEQIYLSLGIPFEGIEEIDTLLVAYIINEKSQKEPIKNNAFVNRPTIVYRKEDTIYLCDLHDVIEIKKDWIVDSEIIEQNVLLSHWNKKVLPTKDEYKNYFIREDSKGVIISSYCRYLLNTPRGEYEMFIPTYDKAKFDFFVNQ